MSKKLDKMWLFGQSDSSCIAFYDNGNYVMGCWDILRLFGNHKPMYIWL